MRATTLSPLFLTLCLCALPHDPVPGATVSAATAMQQQAATPPQAGTTSGTQVTLGQMAESLTAAIQSSGFDCVIQVLPKGDVAALVAGGYQADVESGDLNVELRNLAQAYDVQEGQLTPFDAKTLRVTNIDSAAHTADIFLGSVQLTPSAQGPSPLTDDRPALFVRETDTGSGVFHLMILYRGVRTKIRFTPQASTAPISEE